MFIIGTGFVFHFFFFAGGRRGGWGFGFAETLEVQQVAQGAGVIALGARLHAVQESKPVVVREPVECAGLSADFMIVGGFFFFLEIFHFFFKHAGFDEVEAALAPFGVDHFDGEVGFDGICGVEVVQVGVEQNVVAGCVFVGKDERASGDTVFERVHGGFLAANFRDGAVGFRAVGTGGIDFSLGGHRELLGIWLGGGTTRLEYRVGGSGSIAWGWVSC